MVRRKEIMPTARYEKKDKALTPVLVAVALGFRLLVLVMWFAGCSGGVSNGQGGEVATRGPAPQGHDASPDLALTDQPDVLVWADNAQAVPGSDASPAADLLVTADVVSVAGQDALVVADAVPAVPDAGADSLGRSDLAPVVIPSGCPPATSTKDGFGKSCTRGGGQCSPLSVPGVGMSCSCDDWSEVDARGKPVAPVPPPLGMPCFCMALTYSPDVSCGADGRDAGTGLAGVTAVPYTDQSHPGATYRACVPTACAGIDYSR